VAVWGECDSDHSASCTVHADAAEGRQRREILDAACAVSWRRRPRPWHGRVADGTTGTLGRPRFSKSFQAPRSQSVSAMARAPMIEAAPRHNNCAPIGHGPTDGRARG
jgi:hypothetical protein